MVTNASPFMTLVRSAKISVVFASKNFPGMAESTFLSRSFGDQGVRLRIRKEPRTLLYGGASPFRRSFLNNPILGSGRFRPAYDLKTFLGYIPKRRPIIEARRCRRPTRRRESWARQCHRASRTVMTRCRPNVKGRRRTCPPAGITDPTKRTVSEIMMNRGRCTTNIPAAANKHPHTISATRRAPTRLRARISPIATNVRIHHRPHPLTRPRETKRRDTGLRGQARRIHRKDGSRFTSTRPAASRSCPHGPLSSLKHRRR